MSLDTAAAQAGPGLWRLPASARGAAIDSVIGRVGNSPLTAFLGGGPAVPLEGPRIRSWPPASSTTPTSAVTYLIAYGSKRGAERAGSCSPS
jgi:hypothetical protein